MARLPVSCRYFAVDVLAEAIVRAARRCRLSEQLTCYCMNPSGDTSYIASAPTVYGARKSRVRARANSVAAR